LQCVLDSSVAIDFQEGSFLAPLFALPVQFVVPDILLDHEFLSLDRGQLLSLGLQISSLNGNQLIQVITLRQQHPQPSVNDLAAYELARDLGAVLLTGDGNLRKLAQASRVACHRTLWLLDEIVRFKSASPFACAGALQRMLDQGSRLPVSECRSMVPA
jgi:hypothetical protein